MNIHARGLRGDRTTQAAEGLPRWRWTTAELLRLVELGALDEDEPIELIGGEIVPMSPRGRRHEIVADEIARHWHSRMPPSIYVGVERQFNLDEATYTDPDLLVRPAEIKSYDVRGDTALLVVEVADTSWEKDTGVKARLYASFGVREYWAIDARSLVTRIYRSPSGNEYLDVRDVGPNDFITPLLVPELALRLADLQLD